MRFKGLACAGPAPMDKGATGESRGDTRSSPPGTIKNLTRTYIRPLINHGRVRGCYLLCLEIYQAAENSTYPENINTFEGEAFFDLALIGADQPYKFSTHLTASTSLTFPRYLWVVERLACLKMTLLTISTGTPDREA